MPMGSGDLNISLILEEDTIQYFEGANVGAVGSQRHGVCRI